MAYSGLVEFECGGKFRVRGNVLERSREMVRRTCGSANYSMILTARSMGRSNSDGKLWVEVTTRVPDVGNSIIMFLEQLEPVDAEARAAVAQLNILAMETP